MRTAVLGTGIMGAAMARRLAQEGHEVAVWNRTRARAEETAGDGIAVAGSVGAAVDGAEVVLTSLFDEAAVLGVAAELVEALPADAVWAQTSTVGPQGMARVAAAVPAGERLLDTPVLGTRQPAEAGRLVVLVSGPAAAVERAAPVLDAIGSRTVVAGTRLGEASALKLVCNAWIATLNASLGQALALSEAIGVDPRLFLSAIEGQAMDSAYAHLKGAVMLEETWTPTAFSVDGVVKDVGLMLAAAEGTSFDDALLEAVLARYQRAAALGHGEHDMGAVRTSY